MDAAPTPKSATIDTSEGTIQLEFWSDVAPGHVENFSKLAKKGFYDNLIFHRVIPGFMIQGGCPDGTGSGGPGYQIKAEFNRRADRRHVRGVLSAARSNNPDSAGSQFFLMHQDSPHLDGQYSAFGIITSGLDVVDKIVAAKTGADDRPLKPAKILKITINE